MYTSSHILGTTTINPIKSETITYEKTDSLTFFYELKPNTTFQPEFIFPGLENVFYTINNDGLNQIENYTNQKDKKTYRIVTIGDSHTFGQNVNTQDNYPSQLNKLLNEKLTCSTINKFEVINLGVYAYDIQYTVERFKKRGVKYNPDIVIWLLVSDDFRRINEALLPKMRHYTKEAKENGEYQKQIENGDYYKQWNRAREEVITEFGGLDSLLLLQKEYMNNINNYYSGNLLLTTYASMPGNYKKILKDFSIKRENTFFNDQLPNIYNLPEVILPDLHPNAKGHKLIAEETLDYLIGNNMLPCSFK